MAYISHLRAPSDMSSDLGLPPLSQPLPCRYRWLLPSRVTVFLLLLEGRRSFWDPVLLWKLYAFCLLPLPLSLDLASRSNICVAVNLHVLALRLHVDPLNSRAERYLQEHFQTSIPDAGMPPSQGWGCGEGGLAGCRQQHNCVDSLRAHAQRRGSIFKLRRWHSC